MEKSVLRISRRDAPHGQGIVEYGLLIALIAVGLFLIMSLMGVSVSDVYCRAVNGITSGSGCTGQVYCQDNFDSDASSWKKISGAPAVTNGKMCLTSGMQNLNICSTKMTQSDYVINLNGVTLSNPGRGYGVYFRSALTSNGLNGYAFQYDPGAGNKLLIRRWANGAEIQTPIAQAPINATVYNVPHDFKIVVKGSTFIVFMDGVQVMTAKDSTYPAGGVGLRFWDNSTPAIPYSACINDFSIGQVP